MTELTNSDRSVFARVAAEAYQDRTKTDDCDLIPDLVCDLMHLADEAGQDGLELIRRALFHWYAETHGEASSIVTVKITAR
jgi:hypothetical protein